MATQSDLAALTLKLEALISAVASGELPAEADQVAWLRGVVAGLRSAQA